MSHVQHASDYSADKIHALLAPHIKHLTAEQAQAIELFLREVGGLQNARLAAQLLDEMNRAA